ncbi:MAG: lysylphosphatidylglycerol synthase transmembrane domain-containing protein [bacterium]
MRVKSWQILLPIIIGGVTIYYFVYRDGEIGLGQKNYMWAIFGSIAVILWWLSEALKLSVLSSSIGVDISLLDSLKVIFTGFFLGGVTVFSLGTFPGEYLSLLRIGVDADNALGIVSIRGIMNGIVKGVIAIIVAILIRGYKSPLFKDIFYSIFLTYGIGIFMVYFIIFSKHKYAIKIRDYITKGLNFLEKRYKKISEHIGKLRTALISQSERNYTSIFHNWLPILFTYMISCTILFSLPIFISRFIGTDVKPIDAIILQITFYITQSYLPTPGGSGIVELGYNYFLREVSGAGSTEFIILLRFFTFYLPLLVGGLITFSLINRRRIA